MQKYYLINYNSKKLCKNHKWILNNRQNRLYYVISGEGYYNIKNEKQKFQNGYLYLIPEQFDFNPSYNSILGFRHTYFDFFSTAPFSINQPLEIDITKHPDLQHMLLSLTAMFNECNASENPAKLLQLKNKIVEACFEHIMQTLNEKYSLECIIDASLYDVIKYIQLNYNKEITVNTLANIAHLHPSYFSKIFKKNLGAAPHEYIQNLRLTKSLELLSKGLLVSEIALNVGYNSVYSYSNAFKKMFKCSPTNFLKNQG